VTIASWRSSRPRLPSVTVERDGIEIPIEQTKRDRPAESGDVTRLAHRHVCLDLAAVRSILDGYSSPDCRRGCGISWMTECPAAAAVRVGAVTRGPACVAGRLRRHCVLRGEPERVKHIDVSMTHPLWAAIEFRLDRPNRVCFAYDPATTDPRQPERVEVRLKTSQSKQLAQLMTRPA
jgi:hypothetical protein